jgi:ABC-type antimicrobial peptide transport system permease subunit
MYFLPHRQGTRRAGLMTFYVRRPTSAEGIASAIRDAVRRFDANLPVEEFRTMEDVLHGATTRERLMSVMTGSFAVLATIIAAIGLYGMLAYAVAQRTPEIGLRMALGATRARVRWMILRHVLAVAIVGGAIGLAAAMFLGRAAQTLLFELQFHDPVVLAGSIVAPMLVALAAGFVPADRAARIDPMFAPKYE